VIGHRLCFGEGPADDPLAEFVEEKTVHGQVPFVREGAGDLLG